MRQRNIINIPGFKRELYIKLLKEIDKFLAEKHGYSTDYENTLTLLYNQRQICVQGIEYDTMEYSDWMGIVAVRYFNADQMTEFLECDDDFGEPYIKHLEFKLQDWNFFNEFVVPILTQMGWTGVQLVEMQKQIGLFSVVLHGIGTVEEKKDLGNLTKAQERQIERVNTAYKHYEKLGKATIHRQSAYEHFSQELKILKSLGISEELWVRNYCDKNGLNDA